MRRTTPIIIVVLAAFFLIVDFWPKLTIPNFSDPNGGTRVVDTKLGLDLVGGLEVVYSLQPAGGKEPDAGALATTKTIIENRVNSTGVAEPIVQTEGTDRILVDLPNAKNPDEIRALLVQTGKLDFIPLPPAEYGTQSSAGTYPSTDQTGLRAVGFRLKSTGSQLFGDYTSKHVGEFFAIVLDGKVVSAPVIQSAITGGSGIITGGSSGGFSASEMNSLITVLNYGSLPFPLKEESSNTIGATLAGFSLDRILLAGLIAILLVFLFMLVYYRLPGLVALLALVYYSLLVLAIFRFIPVTLTLAGIAGFVLSIGMAVDANILIFERMKEELRSGKQLTSAMEAGFNRAWNSILDSNVSTLITATILYLFGSATIRGFALVLIIGVLCSMFTAITVTRTILRWVVRNEWARVPRLYGLREEEFKARTLLPGRRGEVRARA